MVGGSSEKACCSSAGLPSSPDTAQLGTRPSTRCYVSAPCPLLSPPSSKCCPSISVGCGRSFLFCVHHDDKYPAGNDKLGPEASLAGRRLGMDFEGKDGWRMYHGETVPGFQAPASRLRDRHHPAKRVHRSPDSLGATARFGPGDVQWLTAGQGIVHCEMFPLLSKEKPNPLELFQIWLNLPSEDKMVTPHFDALEQGHPAREGGRSRGHGHRRSPRGRGAGEGRRRSRGRRADTGVAIWSIVIEPGKKWTMPPASDARVTRTLYFFRGTSLAINGEKLTEHAAIVVRNDLPSSSRPASSASIS